MLEPVKEVLNDKMYSLHWSFVYDPIIHLSTELEDPIYKTFSIEYVDPSANLSAFTTAAGDNIDNNRSSTTYTAGESSHILKYITSLHNCSYYCYNLVTNNISIG